MVKKAEVTPADRRKAVKNLTNYAILHRRNRDIRLLPQERRDKILDNIRMVLQGVPGRAYGRIGIIQVLGGGALTRSEIERALPFSSRTIEKGLNGTIWIQLKEGEGEKTRSKKTCNPAYALVPTYVYSYREGHKVHYGLTDKGNGVFLFIMQHAFDYLHVEGEEKPSPLAIKNRRKFARSLVGPHESPMDYDAKLADFPEFKDYLIQKFGWRTFDTLKSR